MNRYKNIKSPITRKSCRSWKHISPFLQPGKPKYAWQNNSFFCTVTTIFKPLLLINFYNFEFEREDLSIFKNTQNKGLIKIYQALSQFHANRRRGLDSLPFYCAIVQEIAITEFFLLRSIHLNSLPQDTKTLANLDKLSTHKVLDKMAAILQTIFWNYFPSLKTVIFWSIINLPWLGWWLGAKQTTNLYGNQEGPSLLMYKCTTWP